MNKIEILDGAMGSEFIRRGINLPDHIWSAQLNLEAKEIVENIHKEYIEAGCSYITTNTFRTTPRAYLKTGIPIDDAYKLAELSLKQAVEISKSASNSKTNILGSIAPLEDCYKPELFPGLDIASKEFKEIGQWFYESNIDIYLIETMNSIKETKTCLNEISKFNKPIWVSYVLKDQKHIFSGELLIDAINMLKDYNVDCVLVNCSPLYATNNCLDIITKEWDKKWGIYPNLGVGEPSPTGNIKVIHSDDNFIKLIYKAIECGATVIGSCCGSTPHHTRLIKNKINKLTNV